MVIEIPLSQGETALVDESDYPDLAQYSWCLHRAGHVDGYLYACRAASKPTQHMEMMHCRIMDPEPHEQIDHINGNGLDNRRSNLRVCTPQQNQANGSGWGGRSEFRGVYYRKDRKVWRARIQIDGQKHHIGDFPTEIEAAAAFDRHALEEWGDFYTPQVLDSSELVES